MNQLAPFIQPDIWLQQIFETRSARVGGVVRRKVRDVERIVGRDAFVDEVRRRGYRMVENSGQFVIFCNAAAVHVVC